MSSDPAVETIQDDDTSAETKLINRRSLLATLGVATAAGLAGCGGDSGGDDGGDDGSGDTGGDDQSSGTDPDSDGGAESGGDGTESGDDDGTESGGDGTESGGGDNCPAVPSSYSREDVPATLADEPLATIGVPDSGASINNGSALLRVEYSIGSINVQSENNSDTSVEDELLPDLQEVTDDYDLPAGARAQREEAGASDRVDVYIPNDPDVVMVSVAASGPGECLDGSLATIRDEMVNSIQLA